jgi:NifB/MoaA-like Fe-S oxidoreductase
MSKYVAFKYEKKLFLNLNKTINKCDNSCIFGDITQEEKIFLMIITKKLILKTFSFKKKAFHS